VGRLRAAKTGNKERGLIPELLDAARNGSILCSVDGGSERRKLQRLSKKGRLTGNLECLF
jgi:hypothetical protein